MREYNFIQENGGYYLVNSRYPSVVVWGIGGNKGKINRKTALRQAREYCKNTMSKLHIKA